MLLGDWAPAQLTALLPSQLCIAASGLLSFSLSGPQAPVNHSSFLFVFQELNSTLRPFTHQACRSGLSKAAETVLQLQQWLSRLPVQSNGTEVYQRSTVELHMQHVVDIVVWAAVTALSTLRGSLFCVTRTFCFCLVRASCCNIVQTWSLKEDRLSTTCRVCLRTSSM